MSKNTGRPRFSLPGGVALVALAVVAVTRTRTVFGLSPIAQGVGLFVSAGLPLAVRSLLGRYTTQTSRLVATRPHRMLATGAVVTTALWLPYGVLVWLVTSLGSSGVSPLVFLSVFGAPLCAITLVGVGVGIVGIGRWATGCRAGTPLVVGLLGLAAGGFPVPFALIGLLGLLAAVVGIGAMFRVVRHTSARLGSQDRESYSRQHRCT